MGKSVINNIKELFEDEKDIDKISKYLYFMNEGHLVFKKEDTLSYDDVYNIIRNVYETIFNGYYETDDIDHENVVDSLYDSFRRLILDFIDIESVLAELMEEDIDEEEFYDITYKPSIDEWDSIVVDAIINSIFENGEWNLFETETARLLASDDKIDKLLGAIIEYSVLTQLSES